MAYRECPNHGWLETGEYGVDPLGEPRCPICESTLSGYYGDVRSRHGIGGPTHRPRQRFEEALREFHETVEGMSWDEYQDAHPVTADA